MVNKLLWQILFICYVLAPCATLASQAKAKEDTQKKSAVALKDEKVKMKTPLYKNFVKPTQAELKTRLSPIQFEVTQKDGTERPFKNEFWDQHKDGLYVDVISGEPLFSSKDKFDSGTGWPSFTKPLDAQVVAEKTDRKFWSVRTEVRSKIANSHLGHVFDDGPAPTGKRYCMNSASLRFIPADQLESEGYAEYVGLFGIKPLASSVAQETETAILAGGCFWGVEELLRSQTGVIETEVGYTGGKTKKPVYEEVKTGKTGHAEAIRVVFNKKQTSFETVLKFFFAIHDPTTVNAQGNDKGTQYRSAIFYTSPQQKVVAEQIIAKVNLSKQWAGQVVTEVVPASDFYPAEFYHQDYLVKNPGGYTCHFNRKFKFD